MLKRRFKNKKQTNKKDDDYLQKFQNIKIKNFQAKS